MEISTRDTEFARTYAQPLSGLRVSWGSILAGAVTVLAVSLLLWALALAITLSATNATFASLKGSLGALWICGIVTTLIGAFVGGAVAGYLPGNPHRVVAIGHSFLAWCVAFLIASVVEFGMLRSAVNSSANVLMSTASTAIQTTGQAVGGVASGGGNLVQRAENLLTSLGYSPSQAREMALEAQQDVQKALQGPTASQTNQMQAQAKGALNTAIDWTAGLSWGWFGTWFVSAVLAILGGAFISQWLRRNRDEVLASTAVRETTSPSGV